MGTVNYSYNVRGTDLGISHNRRATNFKEIRVENNKLIISDSFYTNRQIEDYYKNADNEMFWIALGYYRTFI
jgi:hypothetical protein